MIVNKKLQVWLPLLFSIVLVIGMVLGYKLNSDRGNKGSFFSAGRGSALQQALDLIRLKYVDSVNTDSLGGQAIQDMMNQLDPHSVYFPPAELQTANEDLQGIFEGIGVEFNIFGDTVNVVYVIPGGPSEKEGLQIGDRIVKVNDEVIAGKNLDADAIRKRIRGESGSKVTVGVLRNNQAKSFTITRGNIPVLSVDAAYMIDKTTGYIKLTKFTEKSYEEFMRAMEDLQKQGLQNLVFDLRGNGGGFMNEAVDMADEFLDGDKLIVYTEGVNSHKQEYRCKRPGIFEKGKLFILVDELTASASEVLAGALQDWCRATIVGRRTFGKGLVQEQFPLDGGGAIRLTIARYYTPMGRSIQRSYEKGKKIYMDELWDRYSHGDLISADSNKASNGKVYLTVCKDTVYGGGGIMPSLFVPLDTSTTQQRLNHIYNTNGLNNATYNYYLQHQAEINAYKTATDYNQQFNRGADIWQELLKESGDSLNPNALSDTEKESIQLRLKALLARYRWRNSGYFQVLNSNDGVVKKVMSLVNGSK